MLLILQRYYFESESQRHKIYNGNRYWCCLSYKDTILKANHNIAVNNRIAYLMLLILQRYYFESESQLVPKSNITSLWCCLSYKDTILKANHNVRTLTSWFWMMLLILQRYYFESESQQFYQLLSCTSGCCLSYKDTILKANHNGIGLFKQFFKDVAYPTKILFWKRITTQPMTSLRWCAMLLILQRYYFESESQLDGVDSYKDAGCCLSYKDTILKANHNTR